MNDQDSEKTVFHNPSRTRLKHRLFILLGIVIWMTLIATVGYLNLKEGQRKSNHGATGKLDPSSSNFSGILAVAKLSNIDVANFKYVLHVQFFAKGEYAMDEDSVMPNRDVQIFFDTQMKNFSSNAVMQSHDLSFFFFDGDLNSYPFDVYFDSLTITAQQSNGTAIPLALSATGALQAWSIHPKVVDGGLGEVALEMTIARSATTKFFSLFMILIMWLLASFVLTLAITVWTRNRKVESPTIGVVTGMLFALPAIRAVQPGIPSIGCTADVVGFFHNMGMVAVAALLLLANYIAKNK